MKSSKYNVILNHRGKKLAFNGMTSSFAEVDDDFIRILNNISKINDECLSSDDKKLLEDMKRGGFILNDDEDEMKLLKLRSNLIKK